MKTLKKILSLLNKDQTKNFYYLIFLMVIGMFLEVISIGSIIPLLTLISDPAQLNDSTLINYLASLQNFLGFSNLLTLIITFLVFIYFIKFIFLSFLAWVQASFVWNLQANISSQLFSNYMYQEYSFFFNKNSSELLRNTLGESGQFSAAVMAQTNLIAEILVIFGIGSLIISYQPIPALAAISLIVISSLIFYLGIKERIKIWGKNRQYHEGLRIQNFNEGIGSLKDIKLMGRENSIISQYSFHTTLSTHNSKFNSLLQSIPRLWLELFAILSLTLIFVILGVFNNNFISILPVIGIFAAAAFRLMPSINRIMYSLQSLRFADVVVANLENELNLKNEVLIDDKFSFKSFNSLKLSNISYSYPSSEFSAISNINLTINKGDKVGIKGANGSGKSTLLDIILAFLEPSSGILLVNDVKVTKQNRRNWQNLIGYVSQNIFLVDDTLERNIALGIKYDDIDNERLADTIKQSQLEEFIASLPEGIKTRVGESGIRLSGGQKQKIAIARSLYHQPQVIIFDEASSALDVNTEEEIFNSVTKIEDKTIIIVTHRFSSLKNCNKVINLQEGKILK